MTPYFRLSRISWAPMVSLALLIRLWWTGKLYGTTALVYCSWFVIALLMQSVATNVIVWVCGLAAQTVLAIVLLVKDRLDVSRVLG